MSEINENERTWPERLYLAFDRHPARDATVYGDRANEHGGVDCSDQNRLAIIPYDTEQAIYKPEAADKARLHQYKLIEVTGHKGQCPSDIQQCARSLAVALEVKFEKRSEGYTLRENVTPTEQYPDFFMHFEK